MYAANLDKMLIIGDHTPEDHPALNAGMKGLVPRGPFQYVGYHASIQPAKIDCYTEEEMVARAAELEKSQSRNSDIYQAADGGKYVPSLDQNGQGYCWMYGPIGGLTVVRSKLKLKYARISAHAAACKMKNFMNEGGWGADALQWILRNGCPDTAHWPEKSMSRSYDTAETWNNAKLYMPDATFADLTSPVYDRDLSFDQMCTMLLRRNPVSADYDWWGHCVNVLDLIFGATQRNMTRAASGKIATMQEFELMWGMNNPVSKGRGVRFRNSWGEDYGDNGYAILTGSKAPASNAVALMSAIA